MNVLEKIVSNKRLPVLFIGSGIPRRYLYRFPNWNELLEESFKKVNDDPFYIGRYREKFKREGLSDFDTYKELGTIIENDFNEAYYQRKIKFGSKNPSWAKKGISPYKMYLRYRFKDLNLNTKNPQLALELAELSQLQNKISAVITTNYDSFIEKYLLNKDFTVFTRQHELFSKDSYNISELYKIHGSIDDAETIIITKKDYDQFNESRKLFIAKMLTLFTESPIIFLGYSFTDENIQQIVIDFLSCLTKEQLENINDNFIFITYKKNETRLVEIKRTITTVNGDIIPITEIQTDNFLEVYQILNKLEPGMTPKIIRDTQRLVKRIVNKAIVSGDASNVIFGIDSIPENLGENNIAIAIGYKEDIVNQYGYSLVPDIDILEDIIFDNKHFNANTMCAERFKSLPFTRLMPVHKYVKNSNVSLENVPKLHKYVEEHNAVEKIISPSFKKRNLKNAPVFQTYQEAILYMEEYKDIEKTFKGILNSIDNLDISQLRELCKFYFYEYTSIFEKSTFFKRVVMYIDFIENFT